MDNNTTESFNQIIQTKGAELFENFRKSIKGVEYKKSISEKIKEIASKENLNEKLLENFFKHRLFLLLSEKINIDELTKLNIEKIKEKWNIDGFIFIKSDLEKILQESIYLSTRFGFKKSVSEHGIRTANEGDSAQFLFVARAVLAGFNCSNVDLRSSKYDAIIDYNSTLLRVQVKGISLTANSKISFFNRPRGGQGIDHTHDRNKEKRITKQECDLYVAVNKETGVCYIIPMSWADSLEDENAKSIPQSKLEDFKENWGKIEETAKQKK